MSIHKYIFTSESVAEGHPDKVCDLISDNILDLFLKEDPESRVAVETLATTNHITLAGEVRGPASVTKERIIETAKQVVKQVGYQQEGFDWRTLDVNYRIHEQSQDIALGVDAQSTTQKEEGAGDQGIMFGFACRETEVLMPAPIYYSHQILKSLAQARKSGNAIFLGPDAKCQISLNYVDFKPVDAYSIIVSTQHTPDATQSEIRDFVRQHVLDILPKNWMCPEELFYVNPTGRFVIGGPDGDTGLTGRKIIVDSYGGSAPHGGGAFSGKDPTKVDRSGAYMARYIAKNVVASGIADKCLVQLSFGIGISKPIALYVNTYNTGKVPDELIADHIMKNIDLSPRGIRTLLKLNRPIYAKTAAYGHFGREPDDEGHFSWEKTDLTSLFAQLS